MKAFAGRPRDWEDVRGILIRQGKKIDHSKVMKNLVPLVELKEEPEILGRLEKLFKETGIR